MARRPSPVTAYCTLSSSWYTEMPVAFLSDMFPVRDSSTSRRVVLLVAGILVALLCAIAAALRYGMPYGVALGALAAGGLAFVAFRSDRQRPSRELIEPSFETSILAFPPESRLGPRTLPRR